MRSNPNQRRPVLRALLPLLRKWVLVIMFISGYGSLRAQTTQGTDFWLSPLKNLVSSDSFFVIISAEKATSALVEIPRLSFSQSLSLGYNSLVRVYIPQGYRPNHLDSVENCGIHVTSSLPVSVYSLSAAAASTDASCIFPTAVQPKGGSYFIANPIVYNSGYNSSNEFCIVAIDDSVTVEIIPKATTTKGYTAGTKYTKKLRKGQTYLVGALNKTGMEGTYIKASAGKRIAVFSGDLCVAIRCPACDHVYEEIPPTTTLGKNFLVIPFAKQQSGYDYQIVATEANTTITENGNTVAVLGAGNVYYRKVMGDSSFCISSDKPILLVQYMTGKNCQTPVGGDPAMLVVNPIEQTITKAIVSTANTILVKTHYITIIVPKKAIDSVYLDGVLMPSTKFKKLACGDFYSYSDSIGTGNHRIACNYGFISYLYGIGGYESYAYSAGSGLRNLQRYILSESYPSCDSGFIVKLKSYGDSATQFKWLFNNTQTDTAKNPFFYVTKPGIYPVKLLYLGYGKTSWDSTFSDVLVEKPEYTDFITFRNKTVCDTAFTLQLPNTPIFSYKWNTGDTTPFLKVNQNGTYWVKIHNRITGCDAADTADLLFYNKVTSRFTYKMAMFCPGIPLYLYDSTKVNNDSVIAYKWYADQQLRSYRKNDTIKSPAANEYEIKLVVYTKNGCADSTSKTILISDIPTAVAGVIKYDTCFGKNLYRFNNGSYTNIGKIIRYKWLFGDGDTSGKQQAFKSYKDSGTFNVKLIAYSEGGCFDTSDAIPVTVYPKPRAGITITDSSVCLNGNYFDFQNGTIKDSRAKSYIWAWGDGSGSTFEDPGMISYTDTGNYQVSMAATFVQTGCADTVYRMVRVNANPKASMATDSSDYCLNRNYYALHSTSDAKGAPTQTLRWYWGDGTFSDDPPVAKKTYNSAGTFKIKMIFSTGKGCTDSALKNVIVYNSPAAAFNISDSGICLDGNFFDIVNNSTAASNAKWDWQWGDGNSSTQKDPGKVTYSNGGKYLITLAIKDPLTGCTDTARHQVTVFDSPTLSIGSSDSMFCTDTGTFEFTDLTNYGNFVPARKWTFDNNSSDTGNTASIKRKFTGKGIHTVMLVSGTSGLCKDTAYLNVNIRYSHTPGVVSNLITYPCVPAKVDFYSNISEGNNWNYSWDMDENNTSALAQPTGISYSIPGMKFIFLTITDNAGCSFEIKDTLTLLPSPELNITVTGANPQCLNGNSFVMGSSVSSATTPVQYSWDLDEGKTSNQKDAGTVSYSTIGTKQIRLAITDNQGCKDTAWTNVSISPQPEITIFSDSGCEGDYRTLTALVNPADIPSGNIEWYLNNNKTFTGNPFKTLLGPVGKHTIWAEVRSPGGCRDTSGAAYLLVYPKPVAAFNIEMQTATGLGIPVVFKDLSTGASQWIWEPEPGITGQGQNYAYLYPRVGNARAWLYVRNDEGCSDTAYLDFVLSADEYGWIPNSFSPNKNGSNDVFKPEGLSPVISYEFSIYNRWGEKIFETRDPSMGWDGTFMGKEVPSGVYAYRVNMIYFTGKKQVWHGEVTLLR